MHNNINATTTRASGKAEIAARYDKALDAFLAASLDARGEEQSVGPLSADRYAELAALEAEVNRLAQQLRDIDAAALVAALATPAAPAPEPEGDDGEDPGDVPEEGYNVPAVYLDGTALGYDALPEPEELERVQLAFPDTENGYADDAQQRAPLGWCNSAAIQLDRRDDSVTVSISVGDPRGAFCFTIRRTPDGTLLMHIPTPNDTSLHMPLRQLHSGTYQVGQ